MADTTGHIGHTGQYATWPRGAIRFCGLPGHAETEHLVDTTTPTTPQAPARTLCDLDATDRYDLGLAVIPIVVIGRSTPSEPGGRILCCPACATAWLAQQQEQQPAAVAPAA